MITWDTTDEFILNRCTIYHNMNTNTISIGLNSIYMWFSRLRFFIQITTKGFYLYIFARVLRWLFYYCIYSDLINYSCPALQGEQLCCPLLRQKNWICNKLESLSSCFFDLDKENHRPSPKIWYIWMWGVVFLSVIVRSDGWRMAAQCKEK